MKRTLLPSNEKFDSTASCHPPSCNFSCHISVGSFSDWKVGRIFRNALFIATILAKMKFFASSFQSKSDGCAAHFWRKTHRSSLFSSRVIFLLSIEKISHLSNVNNDLDSKNHDLLVSFFAQSRCCPISGLCVYAAVQSAIYLCAWLLAWCEKPRVCSGQTTPTTCTSSNSSSLSSLHWHTSLSVS